MGIRNPHRSSDAGGWTAARPAPTTTLSLRATEASGPRSWGATCSVRSGERGAARNGTASFEAADGADVRVGGGAATVQQQLRHGLTDELRVVIVPILLGGGERLFDNLTGGPEGYECVKLVNAGSVVHVRLSRAPR